MSERHSATRIGPPKAPLGVDLVLAMAVYRRGSDPAGSCPGRRGRPDATGGGSGTNLRGRLSGGRGSFGAATRRGSEARTSNGGAGGSGAALRTSRGGRP